jgi:excinuclease UvrABC ATPase subunit
MGGLIMNEQLKILEMIEKGQITAVEGLELLEALNTAKDTETVLQVQTPPAALRHNFKYLKIRVTADNNSVNVNVNIPIRLLTTIGEIAGKMTSMVPVDAQRNMASKGIDISSIDFAKIIEELINGTLDDPDIVDVEAWDEEHNAMVKVKIYVE